VIRSAARRYAARLAVAIAATLVAAWASASASAPAAAASAPAVSDRPTATGRDCGGSRADDASIAPASAAPDRPASAAALRPAAGAAADAELRLRWAVRAFAAEFADRVALAADRVAAATDDAAVREAALRWKLGASTAAIGAGLRPPAGLALADTWALARQSVRLVDGGPAGAAFGAQQRAVVETARTLSDEADALACELLDPAAFDAYRALVAGHAERRPIEGLSFERASIAMGWLRVASDVGGLPTGVGSLAEVAADALDRVGELARRAPDWVRWHGELAVAEQSRRLGVAGRGLRALLSDPAGEPRELLGRLRGEAGRLLGDADRRWGRAMDALRGDRHSIVEALLASPLVRDLLQALAIAVLALLGIGAAIGWTVSRALERRRARRAGAAAAPGLSPPGSPS
jgi:hypothetical protein